MNVLILGAAGRTGVLLVEQVLAAGHSVTAFVRSEDPKIEKTANLKIIIGDATNESDLSKALHGQDAVISTLGPVKPRDTVISVATALLIKTAGEHNVRRVIMMSSFLASPQFKPNPVVKFALKLMDGIVSHFKSAEDLFEDSDLDYTIMYATRLTNDSSSQGYKIVKDTEQVGPTDSISRADVAVFLQTQLSDKTYLRKTVLITSK